MYDFEIVCDLEINMKSPDFSIIDITLKILQKFFFN